MLRIFGEGLSGLDGASRIMVEVKKKLKQPPSSRRKEDHESERIL